MAFARPPVSACGGGVISVKSESEMPPSPSRVVSIRIQTSQNRPKAIAASASESARTLTNLRRRWWASRPARVVETEVPTAFT